MQSAEARDMMHPGEMSELSAGGVAYVRFVLEQFGLSPTALAKRASVSASTLTRALNDPHHKFALSMKTLDKIWAATGTPYVRFINPAQAQVELEKRPPELKAFIERERKSLENSTPLIGSVCAGIWMSRSVKDERAIGRYVDGRICSVDIKDQVAFFVEGNSANQITQNNDVVICSKIDPLRHLFGNREIVVVDRWRRDEDLIETTLRVISLTNDSIRYDLPTSDLNAIDRSITVERGDFISVIPIATVHWILRAISAPP